LFLLLLHSSLPHRALPSFPTRRSSDLLVALVERAQHGKAGASADIGGDAHAHAPPEQPLAVEQARAQKEIGGGTEHRHRAGLGRSEEHTSELQSRENLVCRLLLEKKKK